MPDRGQDNGRQGRKAEAHEQGCGDGYRHAETADSLKEGGKKPADQQSLHTAIGGQLRQGPADDRNRARFVKNTVEEKSAPDDEQHVQTEQQRLGVAHGQQPNTGAETRRRKTNG